MPVIITLQIIVCTLLAITIPMAIYDRYYQAPQRILRQEPRPEMYNQIYELIPLLLIGFSMIFFTLEIVLTVFTLGTILFLGLSKLYLGKRYRDSHSVILEQAQSYAGILLVIWVIRSFIVQPYVVPTGSLEPTIEPGDFIIVSQFSYGVRVPVLGKTILPVNLPKRGDIALFRWPENKDILFIKRVIGLPGDHIVYKNKTLYVNDIPATQSFISNDYRMEDNGQVAMITTKEENLLGIKHPIQQHAHIIDMHAVDIVVPQAHYFMMGDNRDNSHDSRAWGVVPEQNLVGKAQNIWMSVNMRPLHIRWDRIGKHIA